MPELYSGRILLNSKYRNRPYYHTSPVSAQSSNLVVLDYSQCTFIYFFIKKNVYCWYSFELPQQLKAIQLSTNNICFYEENQKNIA